MKLGENGFTQQLSLSIEAKDYPSDLEIESAGRMLIGNARHEGYHRFQAPELPRDKALNGKLFEVDGNGIRFLCIDEPTSRRHMEPLSNINYEWRVETLCAV